MESLWQLVSWQGAVLSAILAFLRDLLEQRQSQSTLKVYVAAISCWHEGIAGFALGNNKTVSLFLKVAIRLHPPDRPVAPMWDLSMVLDSLQARPFEPLSDAPLRWLSFKTAFLLAMVSGKRVGELQAQSIHDSCCRWIDAAFLPKVASAAGPIAPAGPLCDGTHWSHVRCEWAIYQGVIPNAMTLLFVLDLHMRQDGYPVIKALPLAVIQDS